MPQSSDKIPTLTIRVSKEFLKAFRKTISRLFLKVTENTILCIISYHVFMTRIKGIFESISKNDKSKLFLKVTENTILCIISHHVFMTL